MENEFVPYELALQLKELGFNETCLSCFTFDVSKFSWIRNLRISDNNVFGVVAGPLYQQAFSFFREKFGLSHSIILKMKYNKRISFFIINELDNRVEKNKFFNSKVSKIYETHKEAELACLNKLIEISKQTI